MKKKLVVDKDQLQAAIKKAEANGPLSGRSALWEATAKCYNTDNPSNGAISPSVAYLRFVEMSLTCITPVGQRGKMSDEQKSKMQEALKAYRDAGGKVERKSRAEKMASNPMAEKHFVRLREITPAPYHRLLEKVEAGSLMAAIKLNCILCVCGERKEVAKCMGFSCPMYLHRPYQQGIEDEDAADEKVEEISESPQT